LALKATEFGEITQNKGHKVIDFGYMVCHSFILVV